MLCLCFALCYAYVIFTLFLCYAYVKLMVRLRYAHVQGRV